MYAYKRVSVIHIWWNSGGENPFLLIADNVCVLVQAGWAAGVASCEERPGMLPRGS